MIRHGWFEEVNHLIKNHSDFLNLNAAKAIGYISIANGLLNPTLGIDIEKIKQQTRHYAKRQLTWIRHHYNNVVEYTQDNIEQVIKQVREWKK
jgi:tRNA dimethylallyltransferase